MLENLFYCAEWFDQSSNIFQTYFKWFWKWLEGKEFKKKEKEEKENPHLSLILARRPNPYLSLFLTQWPNRIPFFLSQFRPSAHSAQRADAAQASRANARFSSPLLSFPDAWTPHPELLTVGAHSSVAPSFLLPRAYSKPDSIPVAKSRSSRDLLALEPNRAPYRIRDPSPMSLFRSSEAVRP